ADHQAGAALLHQAPEFDIVLARAVGKIVVDGVADQARGIFRRPLVQMHAQGERRVRGELLRPALDERLGIGVQIAFAERRRVHGIEELLGLAHLQLDGPEIFRVRRGNAIRYGVHRGVNGSRRQGYSMRRLRWPRALRKGSFADARKVASSPVSGPGSPWPPESSHRISQWRTGTEGRRDALHSSGQAGATRQSKLEKRNSKRETRGGKQQESHFGKSEKRAIPS